MKKKSTMTLSLLTIVVLVSTTLLHAETSMIIYLEDGLISADIKNVSINKILKYIQDHNGLWVRGDATLLNQKVSSNFEKIPLNEGLKRILSAFNHAMIFDANGRLQGVVLIEKGKKFNIDDELIDLSIYEQDGPDDDGPDDPSSPEADILLPDHDREGWSMENMPPVNDLDAKTPKAAESSKKGPDLMERPKIGPDTEPPVFINPPMEFEHQDPPP